MARQLSVSSMASVLFTTLFAAGISLAAPAGAAPNAADPVSTVSDSTASPEPSRVEFRGVVQDANGGPVRGATIRLTTETDTVMTQSDAAGKFHARITATRGVRVLVQAYGYRDLVRSFRASRPVIQAALALPPPYPLGWVTVTMADPLLPRADLLELKS